MRIVFLPMTAFLIATTLLFGGCRKDICTSEQPDAIILPGLGEELNESILSEEKIKFSGTVLVAKDGEVVLENSYGFEHSRKECDPLGLETAYWIASLSKQFCATLVMMLVQEGTLDLDVSIASYLTGVPSDKQDITIHQLLTHSSGLGDSYVAEEVPSRDKAVEAILGEGRIGSAGSYTYSNDGYQLLACIIEEVTGKSYQSVLEERIFGPAGMVHSGSAADDQQPNQLTVAERGRGSKRKTKGNPQTWNENYGYKGSTGALCSAADLYQWHLTFQGRTLLNDSLTDLMLTPHVFKEDRVEYGYGWNLVDSDNGPVIVHSGFDDFIGHNATLRYYPESDVLFIALSGGGEHKESTAANAMVVRLIDVVF